MFTKFDAEIDLSPILPKADWVLKTLRWLAQKTTRQDRTKNRFDEDEPKTNIFHYLAGQKYAVELALAMPRMKRELQKIYKPLLKTSRRVVVFHDFHDLGQLRNRVHKNIF